MNQPTPTPTFHELMAKYVFAPLAGALNQTVSQGIPAPKKRTGWSLERLDSAITQQKRGRNELAIKAVYYKWLLDDYDQYTRDLEEERNSL
jgi:hypothetical protein